ncbi:hypothetical protein I4I73_03250 [Pseudonocardia sp. KRD-184]|uniref:HK97 gp10 family phage protein n=1 Tax=Pseudonocardia oceani TaxID=2792013 RepID=A0ABS6UG09_9PSEU|nr:hypothetical protein [Pseudonocardia oceani]MBW0088231.1 hypothetical protein [Pseudonocardia oceani]MBW0095013.1 hypothetical protein [Pseudonocardia oceani]MBW0121134.1 hypothetical protein [Pseudonocardia oceani]MBW0131180.1 hypothetical protein [Pseudonocardia oceani]MBW0132558.1 hypothetical protein [Pseudonocardia oceani]
MKIRVRVSNYRQFGRLADRLRAAADGGLRRELGQGIQMAAPPVLSQVRARVARANFPAQIPKGGARQTTGFRARLAAATKTQALATPAGVRFTVDGAVVLPANPSQGHRVALYSDGSHRRRWRHRAFGHDPSNPRSWFNQMPDPWFDQAINDGEPRFRAAVEAAMDRTARQIMR